MSASKKSSLNKNSSACATPKKKTTLHIKRRKPALKQQLEALEKLRQSRYDLLNQLRRIRDTMQKLMYVASSIFSQFQLAVEPNDDWDDDTWATDSSADSQ
nr:hypothetical transcript [Hymenolepis microstoma]CDS35183.1 hypothetical transcript [Hymenolepis microstoma]